MIPRVTTKPYKLPDSETVLPKGTRIFFPIYSLHYDPEYFPDPDKFEPERFSPENRGKIKPCSYLPFGEGPRMCIGKHLLHLRTHLLKTIDCHSLFREEVRNAWNENDPGQAVVKLHCQAMWKNETPQDQFSSVFPDPGWCDLVEICCWQTIRSRGRIFIPDTFKIILVIQESRIRRSYTTLNVLLQWVACFLRKR